MNDPHTPETAIADYFKLKRALEEFNKESSATQSKYKGAMEGIKNYVRKHLKDTGLESVRGSKGIAFFKKVDYINVSDWDAFRMFLSRELAYELGNSGLADQIYNSKMWAYLNQAVNKSTVKQFMEAHENKVPTGLKYDSSQEVFINAR